MVTVRLTVDEYYPFYIMHNTSRRGATVRLTTKEFLQIRKAERLMDAAQKLMEEKNLEVVG